MLERNYSSELQALLELENRHDDLLRQLDELDKRVEKVLSEWLAGRENSRAAA